MWGSSRRVPLFGLLGGAAESPGISGKLARGRWVEPRAGEQGLTWQPGHPRGGAGWRKRAFCSLSCSLEGLEQGMGWGGRTVSGQTCA